MVAIVDAIKAVETGGHCDARGGSGEAGCWQYMPATWRLYSQEVYGEVKEMTYARERYVTTKMVERWVAEGLTASQIGLRWNAGGARTCSSGINRYGVAYDSCAYVTKVLAYLNRND